MHLALQEARRCVAAKFVEAARDALLQLLHASFKLLVGEVLVSVVDRLEFAAVDGDDVRPIKRPQEEFACLNL